MELVALKQGLPKVRVYREASEVEQFHRELLDQKLTAIDTEWWCYTKGDSPVGNGIPLCLQFAWRGPEKQMELAYVHNYKESEGNIHILRPWLTSEQHHKTAHNCPADWHAIANAGIVSESLDKDTMVMDFLVDENRENAHGLKECARDYFHAIRKDYPEVYGEKKRKKNGELYASGEYVVPKLEDYIDAAEALRVLNEPAMWMNHLQYSMQDPYDGLMLFEHHRKILEAVEWSGGKSMFDYFVQWECQLTKIIERVERHGMYLDVPFLEEMKLVVEADIERYEAEIVDWAKCPIDAGSDQKMGYMLYGKLGEEHPIYKNAKAKNPKLLYTIRGLGMPIMRTTETGNPSMKAEHLKELAKWCERQNKLPERERPRGWREIPEEDINGIRTISKLGATGTQLTTFFKGLTKRQRNARIHTRINQIGATSGRWSSSGPNLQNITTGDKDIYHLRDAFCAPPLVTWVDEFGDTRVDEGVLIVADFGQLEYRLLAHFSQDPLLLQMFLENWDMHALTACNIYPHIKEEVIKKFGSVTTEALVWVAEHYKDDRKRAKTLNFEIIYGVGSNKLADQLDITSQEAQAMINGWNATYPYVGAFFDRLLTQARMKGFITTLAGRHRHPNRWLNHDCQPGCPYRRVYDGKERRCGLKGEEERSIKNAAIQGSAKDVTTKAMRNIDNDAMLPHMGYTVINQVHDELIGEAPRSRADEIIERVKPLMENAFSKPLRLAMPVSIHKAQTWGMAK